jgi:hypothetical protein
LKKIISIIIFIAIIFVLINVNAIKLPDLRKIIQGSNTTTIYSSPIVLREIHELGQLTTASMSLNNPNVSIRIRNGLLDVCSITARHVVTAEIKAGIDLNQITEADIDINQNRYTITIPQPSLMSCDITSINQYNTSGRSVFCDTDLDTLRQLAEYQSLIDFRDGAIAENILDIAQREATRQLTQLIRSISGDENIQISFREGDTVPHDLTCRPTPLESWVYDENNSRWKKD